MNKIELQSFKNELEKTSGMASWVASTAAIGSVLGAGAGAISAGKGKRIKGALIGAGSGAVVGGAGGAILKAKTKKILRNAKAEMLLKIIKEQQSL